MEMRVILPRLFLGLLALELGGLTTVASDETSPAVGPPASDKVAIIADALKADPGNPQRHLDAAQALWWRGQPHLTAGQRATAGEFIGKAEHHLQRVIELTPLDSPQTAAQRGQSFYLLSEISAALLDDSKEIEWLLLQATTADPDHEKAREAYAPFDRGDRPAVRTARAGVQMTSIGSRGVPEGQNKPSPQEEPNLEPAPKPQLDLAETNEAGVQKAILFNGMVMNLAHEAQDVVGPIWAYLPELQDLENWKEMEAVRRHIQYQDPVFLAEKTSEFAHQQGGTVINMSNAEGTGRLVFITHADSSQKSEVNVLYAYAKDQVLFAKHYARRYDGPNHREESIRAAKANGETWLDHLAIQKIKIPY
jgi:hypothetical protein